MEIIVDVNLALAMIRKGTFVALPRRADGSDAETGLVLAEIFYEGLQNFMDEVQVRDGRVGVRTRELQLLQIAAAFS